MAQYPKLRTTNKGRDLISAANNNQKAIIFTKIVMGSGTNPTTIDSMTSVVSPKMELPLSPFGSLTNGEFKLRGTLDNSSLTEGFYAKEIGVYAKVDGGTEVLFAYTNGGNYVDYIPDKTSPIDAQIVKVQFVVGDATNLKIQISNDTYITYLDLDNHNADELAHKPITDMIATILGTGAWNNPASNNIANMITLLGQGGIVAAKLADTGYVKFANGFTIQWGVTGNDPGTGGATGSFPIAFTKAFTAVASAVDTPSLTSGIAVYSISTTGIVIDTQSTSYSKGYRYIAIGIS